MGQSRRGCARDSSAGRFSRARIASPLQTPPAAGVRRQMPACEAAPGSQNHGRWGTAEPYRTRSGQSPRLVSRGVTQEPRRRRQPGWRQGRRSPLRASGCRSASSARTRAGARQAYLPRSIRPTGSGPPRHERRGLHCVWTAFVIGPDQSSPRGDCRRRTTGALGAASLRPPLQARLRTECGLAAPLNRPSSRAARTSSRAWAVRSPRRSQPPRWQATRLWARVSPS